MDTERLSGGTSPIPPQGPRDAWSGLLLRFVLLLEELAALFQRVLELRLRNEQHVVREELLARQPLLELLDPFGILVVLARRAGRPEAHGVVVALKFAHLYRVGQPVQ